MPMIKDDASNRKYVTLLSLISDNSGRFDICALIYDVCTGNKETYFDEKTGEYEYESILERMIDVRNISKTSYLDLKRIINYIKKNFVTHEREIENENNLIVFPEDETEATYVSTRFDDVFIKNVIERYYHDEL